jgi:hypothetical protein
MRLDSTVISVIIIICVAAAADYDNFFSALVATAPSGLPLVRPFYSKPGIALSHMVMQSLYIVYSKHPGDQKVNANFSAFHEYQSLLLRAGDRHLSISAWH